ncbi:uncharacterized protein LOC129740966 [Uranotaenia lowii]|uniref:uncharacterized protein LOC129740966 n=1 Tax=Uranotaenia lowii TaxID=190385 RepID=UPI00247B26F2|nr:uncharacterized protein LOC129740966 [Uranotaenia lowii]
MESPPANPIPSAPTPLLLCYFFHICGSSAQGPPPDPSDPYAILDDFADSWQKRLDPLLKIEAKIYGIQNNFDNEIRKLKDANADPTYQAVLQDISVMLRQLTDAMKADYSEALSYIIKDAKAFVKIVFEPYITAKSGFMKQAVSFVSTGPEAKKACAANLVNNYQVTELGYFAFITNFFAVFVVAGDIYYYHYYTEVIKLLKANVLSFLSYCKNPLYSSNEIKSYFELFYPDHVMLCHKSIGASITDLFNLNELCKDVFYTLNQGLLSALIQQQQLLDSC